MKGQWLFFIVLFSVIIGKIYNSDALALGSSILTPYIYVYFTHTGYDKKKCIRNVFVIVLGMLILGRAEKIIDEYILNKITS